MRVDFGGCGCAGRDQQRSQGRRWRAYNSSLAGFHALAHFITAAAFGVVRNWISALAPPRSWRRSKVLRRIPSSTGCPAAAGRRCRCRAPPSARAIAGCRSRPPCGRGNCRSARPDRPGRRRDFVFIASAMPSLSKIFTRLAPLWPPPTGLLMPSDFAASNAALNFSADEMSGFAAPFCTASAIAERAMSAPDAGHELALLGQVVEALVGDDRDVVAARRRPPSWRSAPRGRRQTTACCRSRARNPARARRAMSSWRWWRAP